MKKFSGPVKMSDFKKILVVDDEPQILRVLGRSLSLHRFDVRSATDGKSGFDLFGVWLPDLVITDLAMPLMDGLELCREIRKISKVPIIILSVKGEESMKVEALDEGADDYVTKPFSMNELMARVRAALRRAPEEKTEESRLEVGDFLIDFTNYQAFARGQEVHLTPKEFELLVYMIKNHGKVLTHRNLLSAVWGSEYLQHLEYLRVFLGNLRKKIEVDPSEPHYILTEPWVGYRFNPSL